MTNLEKNVKHTILIVLLLIQAFSVFGSVAYVLNWQEPIAALIAFFVSIVDICIIGIYEANTIDLKIDIPVTDGYNKPKEKKINIIKDDNLEIVKPEEISDLNIHI